MRRRLEYDRQDCHEIPKELTNMFIGEQLKSMSDAPAMYGIKSKDCGGHHSVVSLTRSVMDESDETKYLSDYHIATTVIGAYTIQHNQATILEGVSVISDHLVQKGVEKDSDKYNAAIGALSDKLFEGIEFRMEPEKICPSQIIDMKIDIDQVCLIIIIVC